MKTQYNGLASIGSEIELTQNSVFDFVRLPNSIELNPRIEFDCVRFTMPGLFHLEFRHLDPVVQRADNFIQWISCYPAE